MRMFLAIELPDEVRKHLVGVQEKIVAELPDVSITKPENLHITLKFLGEVDEKRQAELCESLRKVTAGPIELTADRLVCFPPRGPFRIIAAAMSGSDRALSALHAAIEQRCRYLGFEKETRKYQPHVTLARARRPVNPAGCRAGEDATAECWPGPTFKLPEFVLMISRLHPQGSQYSVAQRFMLS
jgi:2'-5' RNA ligase